MAGVKRQEMQEASVMNETLSALTSREQEILNLLLGGVTPKEIAYKLNIGYKTFDTHRSNLYRKLGVQSIQELMVKYAPNQIKDNTSSDETVQKPEPAGNNSAKGRRRRILIPVGIAIFAVLLSSIGYFFIKSQAAAKPVPFTGFQMGFSANGDEHDGGNSTGKLNIINEIIDGVNVNGVINIEVTLAEGFSGPNAQAYTVYIDLIDQLKKAKGIRFKAIGDGKNWRVQLHTEESLTTNWASYEYPFGTVPNQVVDVDIPYSSLRQPAWLSKAHEPERVFEFSRKRIIAMAISTNSTLQGLGSSSIKIYDFEVY